MSVPAFQIVYILVQDFETVGAGLRQCTGWCRTEIKYVSVQVFEIVYVWVHDFQIVYVCMYRTGYNIMAEEGKRQVTNASRTATSGSWGTGRGGAQLSSLAHCALAIQ